ncbi:MAG: PAS domain-containing sensor histidine kinase [Candidatus Obscuribacter sp.]|nr:PAS domain-containing sensor histidine kinase [Candidatus Obscuribacter sp.]MBP6591818.1 PAS domain-containing sensor histidine kinase [Candidatus Obscuribacter sp.]
MLSLSSLRAKIFILISVPLALQLALVGVVASLQNQAEDEARRAEISRKISDEVVELTRDILSVRSNFGTADSVHLNPVLGTEYQTLAESIEAHFKNLRSLTQSNLEISRALNRTITTVHEAEDQLTEARKAFVRAKRSESPSRLAEYKKLVEATTRLSKELFSLGNAGRDIAQASPEKQRKYREEVQTLLIAGGCANILLTLILGLLLTRSIINRLNIINDNSFRLASNRPLNPPMIGADEITRVDAIFHQMATELKRAANKEKAILESAYDCICSLDSDLHFVTANGASEDFFAVPSDEIVMHSLTDFIESGDITAAFNFRDEAKNGRLPRPIKLTIKRQDGESKQVLWSARWAPYEGNAGELFSIFHDVTEQSRAEELKQEVVAMVTHDLRTPLMTIQTFLTMLADGFYQNLLATSTDSERSQRHLLGAQRGCNRMMILIRDLIDIEKIKSGNMQTNPKTIAVKDVFENVIEETAPYASEMKVVVKYKPTKSIVIADEEMLYRVVTNLVSNAIKFTPHNGTVTLSARNSGNTVTFSVADQGPGLEPHMLTKVFDRFQQAANQTAKSRGGSGLGLTICKAIVHLHQGKIWVESVVGEGSEFFFTIPKA